MLCFEVRLNGEKIALAGVPEGVLSIILSSLSRPPENSSELTLEIGGYVQETHLHWAQPSVSVGDRIEILVLDALEADPPIREHREPRAEREQAERQYYERLKQKYES